MATAKKRVHKQRKKRRRTLKGGKTTSDGCVSLWYKGFPLKCSICAVNKYEEVISTLGKSKARTMVRNLFLGDGSGEWDNTSVITYFCLGCGYCRMIRNNDTSQSIISQKEKCQ
jgi:hypothetical protein